MKPFISFEHLALITEQHQRQRADALSLLTARSALSLDIADAIQNPHGVLLLGMGSSHHINRTAEPYYRELGIYTYATPVTELLASPMPRWRGAVILTSQSGNSAELRQYADHPSGESRQHFGVTLDPTGFLAQRWPSMTAPGGPELGVVSTRGFLLGLLLHLLILERLGLSLDGLTNAFQNEVAFDARSPLSEQLRASNVVVFIANGTPQGLAEYAALALMELIRKPCFAMSTAQYLQSPYAQSSAVLVILFTGSELYPVDSSLPASLTELPQERTPSARMLIEQLLRIQDLLLQTAQLPERQE